MPETYKEQVELDIKRTFIDNEIFTADEQLKTKTLNILLAYSKRNTSVGYCQGMNYIGGILARVIKNEEDSFWALTCLFESVLPLDYYCLMTEILVDQKVFIQLFKKKKSKLYQHLKNNDVDIGLVWFPWFVCLLTENLNPLICETVYDFLFLEGNVAIFRAMFAIFNILEPYILKNEEFSEIYKIFEVEIKELITEPEIFIKQMSKFSSLKIKFIK